MDLCEAPQFAFLSERSRDEKHPFQSSPLMNVKNKHRTTLRDVARVAFRQWGKIAVFVFGVLALTVLVISQYPRSYASESKFLVRVGRETIGLDPTATTGETIMLQKTQDDEINSVMNILTSRVVIEQVVERVGSKRILDNQPGGEAATPAVQGKISQFLAWLGNNLDAIGLLDPGTEADQAIRQLESKYRVWADRHSMVINVRFSAASPELARDVVDAITKVFLAEHAKLNQNEGSLKFFAEQTDTLRNDLIAAQTELRDRKNKYQLTTGTNRLSILEKTKDAMRQKVYDLELQESDLTSRYQDAYPLLQEVRRERVAAQKALMKMSTDEGQRVAKISNVSLPATSEVTPPIETPDGELQALNDQEFELLQLEREVRLLERKYEMHVEKLEQARLNDALGREQIGNVKIAQPATLVYKPISPKKPLILGLGVMLALVGGVGIAYFSETFDQSLRTTGQVESVLGLPVLASLPYRKSGRKKRATSKSAGVASSDENLSQGHDDGPFGSYRGLVTSLRSNQAADQKRATTVGVMGCEPTQMSSRVAANVAIQAASTSGDSVLLIDADPRNRRIAKRFGLNGAPGWREVVAGSAVAQSCIQTSTSENLAVMGPGGTNGASAAAPWSASALQKLDGVKNEFGLVVVDLPPIREQDGLPAIAGWIDEMILVVEAERTRIQTAERARDTLTRAGVNVSGVVLVNRRDYIPRWLYRRL
jgi:uncharacterized protein involved in exopolysaccharide biosynthesis/Mrp family chromosome partitioning ATPase